MTEQISDQPNPHHYPLQFMESVAERKKPLTDAEKHEASKVFLQVLEDVYGQQQVVVRPDNVKTVDFEIEQGEDVWKCGIRDFREEKLSIQNPSKPHVGIALTRFLKSSPDHIEREEYHYELTDEGVVRKFIGDALDEAHEELLAPSAPLSDEDIAIHALMSSAAEILPNEDDGYISARETEGLGAFLTQATPTKA